MVEEEIILIFWDNFLVSLVLLVFVPEKKKSTSIIQSIYPRLTEPEKEKKKKENWRKVRMSEYQNDDHGGKKHQLS